MNRALVLLGNGQVQGEQRLSEDMLPVSTEQLRIREKSYSENKVVFQNIHKKTGIYISL